MSFFRCSGEGGGNPFPYKVAIVQSSSARLIVNTMSSNTLDVSPYITGTLKGVMCSVGQRDSYCFGGVSIHTTDEKLLNWLPKEITSQMTEATSGGYIWCAGGLNPTWSISGTKYTCSGLVGSVNNNTKTLYPMWFFIYE